MSDSRPSSAVLDRLFKGHSYRLTESIFFTALGIIYLCAFGSLLTQIVGLYGAHGILPLAPTLAEVRQTYGQAAYSAMPSIFWFGVTDRALLLVCAAGCFGGALMVIGLANRIANITCWTLYLSIISVGSPFTNFQWDALLLESGFLAIWSGTPLLVWGFRFLLFRLMLESGIVKLSSGDLNWRNLGALRYHFYTQPLPTPLAYPAAHLPETALQALTAATLFIEIAVPFLLFLPRKLRLAGTALLATLQIAILLTGNYGFFNLLSLALCLWGLDDRALRPLARLEASKWRSKLRFALQYQQLWRGLATLVVAAVVILGAGELLGSRIFVAARRWLAPFDIVNTYGLFANMTTSRSEIILQGSDDAETWVSYEFRYKPGDPHRGLPIVVPRMPRLDWQMWFAALGNFNENRWVGNLMYRLLVGEPTVRALLLPSPGPQHRPRYLRAQIYSYRFTTSGERARTGDVWHRELIGDWFGPVSLTGR